MNSRWTITTLLLLALALTVSTRAQDKKEGDSELYKRALESLKNIQEKDKKDEKPPPKPEAKKESEPKPAPPSSGSKLPSFSEAVPPPQPPKPKESEKKELPKPAAPTVIRIPSPSSQTPRPAEGSGSKQVTGVKGRGSATTYSIQSGDTFSSIAHKLYGDEGRWIAIAKANPLVDPTRLKVGQVLKLPDLAARDKERAAEFEQVRKEIAAPTAVGSQTVVVEPGDNLSMISQRVYGRASLWKLIFEANKDQLKTPDELHVGMKLKIPARGGTTGPKPAAPTPAPTTPTPEPTPAPKPEPEPTPAPVEPAPPAPTPPAITPPR